MANKPFDASLHAQHDKDGRDFVKAFYKKHGLDAQDNPDQYGVDLLVYYDDSLVGYAEVEVRQNWDKEQFPFDTLNVPERKQKLLTNDLETTFFSVSKDHSRAFMCQDRIVLSSPLMESANKYVGSGEKFFKVPIDQIKLVQL